MTLKYLEVCKKGRKYKIYLRKFFLKLYGLFAFDAEKIDLYKKEFLYYFTKNSIKNGRSK